MPITEMREKNEKLLWKYKFLNDYNSCLELSKYALNRTPTSLNAVS